MRTSLGKQARRFGLGVLLAVLATGEASAGALDEIKQSATIRIAYRGDAAPFSAQAEGSSEPTGYSVALCQAVAASLKDQLGLAQLSIQYVLVSAADRFETIQQGRADILCEATTATLARRGIVDFSIPTFVDGASIMIRADGPATFEGLAGKKIGVLGGTTTEDALRNTLEQRGMQAEVIVAKSHPDGLRMLEAGEVSAYFGDHTILQYLRRSSKAPAELLLADNFLTIEPYALAIPRGDDDFRLAVDRALSHVYRSGEVGRIFAQSFGADVKPAPLVKALFVIAGLPE